MRNNLVKIWRFFGIYFLSVAMGGPVSVVHAGPAEENFLSLQSAENAAASKDFDHFVRIIAWPGLPPKLPGITMEIYFSHQTATLPERGYAFVKARTPEAKFWERSRDLNEEEVRKICDLLEGEEIFSLRAKSWSCWETPPLRKGAGPGRYLFTHIDKAKHAKEEVERGMSAC